MSQTRIMHTRPTSGGRKYKLKINFKHGRSGIAIPVHPVLEVEEHKEKGGGITLERKNSV